MGKRRHVLACSEQYGNCTDFHALFNSLARARGIPARFGIGFTVPAERPAGTLRGYHCWGDFYLPDIGWVPIDASEADKHPDKRELYFGTHPADRVLMTVGRDLQLGEGHASGALNYFVHPHVEVNGQKVANVELVVSFRDLESDRCPIGPAILRRWRDLPNAPCAPSSECPRACLFAGSAPLYPGAWDGSRW